jgi:cytochrome b6-f complex iron-sulfur subunit
MDIDNKEDAGQKNLMSRRYFFEIIGFGAIGIALVGGFVRAIQYLSPNVLLEPSPKFKAGQADNYQPGSVTFIKEQKVYIVRAKEGYFYAESAVCTHLGCITRWRPERGIIACPCHGSKFTLKGNVIAGPAPRPLPRFLISMNDQGQLVVDKSKTVSEKYILKT